MSAITKFNIQLWFKLLSWNSATSRCISTSTGGRAITGACILRKKWNEHISLCFMLIYFFRGPWYAIAIYLLQNVLEGWTWLLKTMQNRKRTRALTRVCNFCMHTPVNKLRQELPVWVSWYIRCFRGRCWKIPNA